MRSLTWLVAIGLVAIAGFSTPNPASAQDCPGDCNGDLIVSIDEVVACIGRALGPDSLGCPTCDLNEDGQVMVDELIEIVGITLQPLLITAQGTCMSPGPPGLVSCPVGTEVTLSRCLDRAACLDDPEASMLLDTVTTDANGEFTLMTCRGAGSVLLFEAAIEPDPAAHYHTMSFGPISADGSAAGEGRALGQVSFEGLEISPRSEAAIRLLAENGLENFTDEGVIEIIQVVARVTADSNFAGLSPAAAADLAESDAAQNRTVQATIEENRIGDVDVTQGGDVDASSVFSPNFPARLSIDGDRTTSWFSDGATGGETETFRWTGRRDDLIASVSILSNRDHPEAQKFGFASVRVEVLDVQGLLVFTETLPLPGDTDPDVTVFPDVVGRTVLLTFTGHDDPTCGGFSELIVVARR